MAIIDPFAGTVPSRVIWVSPTGSNTNGGSEGAPLRTIQAAVDQAKGQPGTAIMVKAGTYNENLKLNGLHGTPDKPILLVSADGPHAAKIVGGPSAATVTGYGVSNLGIKGFHVVSNTSEGDIGGFKLWGPWENPAQNLVVTGNLITGKGQDGFKLFNGAKNNLIVGNTIDGTWRQEAIDNVSVEDTVYAYNTIRGSFGYTGLTVKTGSRDIEIVGNLFDGTRATGLFIGGFGNSHVTGERSFDPSQWGGYDAARVHAHGNVFGTGHYTSVNFVGAHDSVLENNYIGGIVQSVNHLEEGRGLFNYHSYDNTIRNNTVARTDFFKPEAGESKGYVVAGNAVGSAMPPAGADTAIAKAFLSAFGTKDSVPVPTDPGGSDPGPIVVDPAEPPPAPAPAKWADSAAWTTTKYGSTVQAAADSLTGTSGHDYLDGRSGIDTMAGGKGDDTYVIGHSGDKAVEKAGEGVDTALLWGTTWTLAANVENLVIRQTTGAPVVTDNQLDNVLVAQARTADTFRFVKDNGHDLIKGFAVGQDRIVLDASVDLTKVGVAHSGGDMVLTVGDGDTITLRGVASTTKLADLTGKPAPLPPSPAPYAPPQGEWKTSAQWTASKFGSTVQGRADSLTGTSGHDYLDGRSGADTMAGGRGDDTYVIGHSGDRVVERAGEGVDTALLWGTTWTLAANVENLVIRQTTGAPVVTDNQLDNVLVAQARTADTFRFVKDNGHDLVKGFAVGQDRIALDASVNASQVEVHHAGGNMILELPGDNSITLANVGASVHLQDVLG